MAKANVFFLTSYSKTMLKNYTIFLQGKKQNVFFSIEKGDNIIYINELELSLEKNESIEIKIQNENKEENIYKLKQNFEKENIFLFNYDLDKVSTKLSFIKMNCFAFWKNDEKYINESYSDHEKFSFFYKYLLIQKDDSKMNIPIYDELIKTYLERIKDDNMPFDISISILIIYQELNRLDKYAFIINKLEKNSECGIIKILEHKDFYLYRIKNCLFKLLEYNIKDKNKII